MLIPHQVPSVHHWLLKALTWFTVSLYVSDRWSWLCSCHAWLGNLNNIMFMCSNYQISLVEQFHRVMTSDDFNHGHLSQDALTHWGRVTHICISKLTITGSDNGLSPGRHQAIIWTNAGILLLAPLGTNLGEIWIEVYTFSLKKCILKCRLGYGAILSRPQCVNHACYVPKRHRPLTYCRS